MLGHPENIDPILQVVSTVQVVRLESVSPILWRESLKFVRTKSSGHAIIRDSCRIRQSRFEVARVSYALWPVAWSMR